MHIETSADARQSRRHAAGDGRAGLAADDRGYFAAAASRLSSWWSGTSRPQGLTADAEPGAGLQARNKDSDPPSNGDAFTAPLAGDEPPSQSIHTNPIELQGIVGHKTLHTLATYRRLCIYHTPPNNIGISSSSVIVIIQGDVSVPQD